MTESRKSLVLVILTIFVGFFIIIAFWTVLPRQGTLEIPGEGMYTGQLKGKTFHGYGTFVSYEIEGISYEGEWKDGVFQGQGTITYNNGSKLTGEFKNGSPNGKVKIVFPDGHTGEVEFCEEVPR